MLLAGLVAIAVAASSCGVGGTRPIVKIGLTAPFTGFDESIGYSVIGVVRLAVRERNLSGGVAGYSVELAALDDANDPATAAQRAREMVVDPAVMAVLGGFDGRIDGDNVAGTVYDGASGAPFTATRIGKAPAIIGSAPAQENEIYDN